MCICKVEHEATGWRDGKFCKQSIGGEGHWLWWMSGVTLYLHWVSLPIDHVLRTGVMLGVAPVEVKLDRWVRPIEPTSTHLHVTFCQLELHWAVRSVYAAHGGLKKKLFLVSYKCFFQLPSQQTEKCCRASIGVPVCPVFTIDLMAGLELKLRVKFPRLLSVSTWPVTMSTGDCLFPPQEEPGMSAQWDGVCSTEG